MKPPSFVILNKQKIFFTLISITLWFYVINHLTSTFHDLISYCEFALLGILGAIFANSTGAGGGVIFIPFFNQLGLTEAQSVSTSFAIQCFGMTAGAITWYRYFNSTEGKKLNHPSFTKVISFTSIGSILGIWLAYGLKIPAPSSLHLSFAGFSIILGLGLLISLRRKQSSTHLLTADYFILLFLSICGGIVTAWLSVGVGELVALYLIFRGVNVAWSIAVAVILSAITVWTAIPQHLFIETNIYWEILVFAGPGAVFGGIVARFLALAISPIKLKTLFAVWILLTGIVVILK